MNTQKEEQTPGGPFFATALALAVLAGGAFVSYRVQRTHAMQRCEEQNARWYVGPSLMTKLMMERYGPPDSLSPLAASWFERGPWKRIVVHADRPETSLEQAINYPADAQTAQVLRAFSPAITVDTVNDEMSARSNNESLNFLSLNLANEVAEGRRDPQDALSLYLRMAKLAASGKSSPYVEGLMFEPYTPPMAGRWGERYAR
jgi:hypothetical protein